MDTNSELRGLFFSDQNRSERIVPFPIDFSKLSASSRKLGQRNGDDESNGSGSRDGDLDSLNETAAFLSNISTAQWLEQKTDSGDRVVHHLNDDISYFLVEQSIKIRSRHRPSYDNSTFESDPLR